MAHTTHTSRRKGNHHQPVNEQNLLITTLLNFVITVVEITGGVISGSLALLSDALHNLSDTFATFIAYLATLIGKRKATPRRTFGYKRLEILAALLNAVILIVMSIFLLREAYLRWRDPHPINSMVMLVVAMVGLLANLYAVIILKKDAHKSINVRAAYVHLVGDSLSSVLVIIAGILIQIYKFYWIDPLITLLISVYIIREGYVILRDSVNILMQSTPGDLDLARVKRKVEQIQEVNNIHHIHAWMLTDQEIHLEAHVELKNDAKLSEAHSIQREIEQILVRDFHIHHMTLQFEYDSDHSSNLIHREEL